MKTETKQEYNPPEAWVEGVCDSLAAIQDERRKQFMKWGIRANTHGTNLKILVEEVGEVAEAMLDLDHVKDHDDYNAKLDLLRNECIQVGAVAAQMVQAIDQGSA